MIVNITSFCKFGIHCNFNHPETTWMESPAMKEDFTKSKTLKTGGESVGHVSLKIKVNKVNKQNIYRFACNEMIQSPTRKSFKDVIFQKIL